MGRRGAVGGRGTKEGREGGSEGDGGGLASSCNVHCEDPGGRLPAWRPTDRPLG